MARKSVEFLIWLAQISAATLIGMAYEYYWFGKGHLLGYLWLLNAFKIEGSQADQIFEEALERHSLKTRVAINFLCAFIYWLLLHRGILRPSGLWGSVKDSFLLFAFFWASQQTVVLMGGLHWQPQLHNCIHALFLLFGMSLPFTIFPGPRILRLFKRLRYNSSKEKQ